MGDLLDAGPGSVFYEHDGAGGAGQQNKVLPIVKLAMCKRVFGKEM